MKMVASKNPCRPRNHARSAMKNRLGSTIRCSLCCAHSQCQESSLSPCTAAKTICQLSQKYNGEYAPITMRAVTKMVASPPSRIRWESSDSTENLISRRWALPGIDLRYVTASGSVVILAEELFPETVIESALHLAITSRFLLAKSILWNLPLPMSIGTSNSKSQPYRWLSRASRQTIWNALPRSAFEIIAASLRVMASLNEASQVLRAKPRPATMNRPTTIGAE